MARVAETAESDLDGRGEDIQPVPEEAGDSELIDFAFSYYMDNGLDYLMSLGLSEGDALEAAFQVATLLAEEEVLPEFPDDPEDDAGKAVWLVAAYDNDFFEFIAETLSEDG